MTKRRFAFADPHFSHRNVIKFTDAKGVVIRDFESVEQMDALIATRWNDTVQPHDTIYVLGDLCLNRSALPIFEKLNGRKILVKGNHDILQLKDYLPYFEDIRAYKVFPESRTILSHIPIHPMEMQDEGGRYNFNIHGHLHERRVKRTFGHMKIYDERYLCVSAEQVEYRPVDLDVCIEGLLEAKRIKDEVADQMTAIKEEHSDKPRRGGLITDN